MYKFNLSRTEVTASYDKTRILGYNYYLSGFIDEQLKRKELIYTTLGSDNPLDKKAHDLKAQEQYARFIQDKKVEKNISYIPKVSVN